MMNQEKVELAKKNAETLIGRECYYTARNERTERTAIVIGARIMVSVDGRVATRLKLSDGNEIDSYSASFLAAEIAEASDSTAEATA